MVTQINDKSTICSTACSGWLRKGQQAGSALFTICENELLRETAPSQAGLLNGPLYGTSKTMESFVWNAVRTTLCDPTAWPSPGGSSAQRAGNVMIELLSKRVCNEERAFVTWCRHSSRVGQLITFRIHLLNAGYGYQNWPWSWQGAWHFQVQICN